MGERGRTYVLICISYHPHVRLRKTEPDELPNRSNCKTNFLFYVSVCFNWNLGLKSEDNQENKRKPNNERLNSTQDWLRENLTPYSYLWTSLGPSSGVQLLWSSMHIHFHTQTRGAVPPSTCTSTPQTQSEAWVLHWYWRHNSKEDIAPISRSWQSSEGWMSNQLIINIMLHLNTIILRGAFRYLSQS